ncbi:MAG: hypothetical protein WBM98_08255 [Maribacter sp.]
MAYGQNDYVKLVGMSTQDYNKAIGNNFNSAVEGSPYLYPSWLTNAKVYFEQKEYTFPSLNYNIYAERFEAKLSKDSVFIINPKGVDKVVLGNKVFKRYLDPEFQRNSYFEELARLNDVVLLRKYFAEIQEASLNPLTKVPMGRPKLLQKEKFYTLKGEDELKSVRLKKSVILNLVDDDDVKILKTYAREHGLSFRNSDDVIQILIYYNSLGA